MDWRCLFLTGLFLLLYCCTQHYGWMMTWRPCASVQMRNRALVFKMWEHHKRASGAENGTKIWKYEEGFFFLLFGGEPFISVDLWIPTITSTPSILSKSSKTKNCGRSPLLISEARAINLVISVFFLLTKHMFPFPTSGSRVGWLKMFLWG